MNIDIFLLLNSMKRIVGKIRNNNINLEIILLIFVILLLLVKIYSQFSRKTEIEKFFYSKSSVLMKNIVEKNNIHFDLTNKTNQELKNIQNDFIDDLINTHRDFIKDNQRYQVYHFLNHNCPSSTMRVLYSEDRKEYEEKKMLERSEPILGQLNTTASWKGRFLRRRDFHKILGYGNYRLINLYRDKNCLCMDNFLENQKTFSVTLLSKQTDKKLLEDANVLESSSLKEGTYFLIYDTIDKVYYTFRVYTMQNEGIHYKQKELNIFYDKEKEFFNLSSEFRYLFEMFGLKIQNLT